MPASARKPERLNALSRVVGQQCLIEDVNLPIVRFLPNIDSPRVRPEMQRGRFAPQEPVEQVVLPKSINSDASKQSCGPAVSGGDFVQAQVR